FDYGFNFTECGVVKFFKKLGNGRYAPFMCLSDFADAQINGFGFRRSQTIGNRSEICDHRFIKNGITAIAWPPGSLEEWKMDRDGNFT
ncbi:MAG: L-2-amino-thiazoline-4-carboxylic acid hydrolase, partial [Candidatus Thorarchaeota archaeon]